MSDAKQTSVPALGKDRPYRPSAAMRTLLGLVETMPVGSNRLILPDGREKRVIGSRPGPDAEIRIHRDRLARRMLTGGMLGFCEAYLDGDWTSPDVPALFEWALRNENEMRAVLEGKGWVRALSWVGHMLRPNSKTGARRNISAHYDLGNRFYAEWLDRTMTYSSAIYADEHEELEAAQHRKWAELADRLAVAPGQRVLEIGCGWGGFAEYLAKERGAQVVGITISEEQHRFASERIAKAGLGAQVEIRLQDYRDVPEQFDRIASIEMFEAVGERYWPVFFNGIRERLVEGGRAALQIITIEDHRFGTYRRGGDYIQKYIFPGGMLPSIEALQQQVADAALRWEGVEGFGQSYARTLADWQQRFQAAWPRLSTMGFDERFKRMWEQYLDYCRAGFTVGTIDVVQLTITRD